MTPARCHIWTSFISLISWNLPELDSTSRIADCRELSGCVVHECCWYTVSFPAHCHASDMKGHVGVPSGRGPGLFGRRNV